VRRAVLISILLLSLSHPWGVSLAHGVKYKILRTPPGIEVRYEDVRGSPMSYAAVKVYPPDNPSLPFQEGYTDRNGRFAFLPDKPGVWKVEVNDGMGHAVEVEIEVDEEFKTTGDSGADGRRLGVWRGILTGVGIIWGLMGTIFYISVRRRNRGEGGSEGKTC